MSLRSQIGDIRRSILAAFYRRTVRLGDAGPLISFTFDDFPRSAYSTGGAILENSGARGTYYVTPGLAHTSNELGDLFIEEDVQRLLEKGHEIASQTFHHSSCRSVALSTFADDVQKGIEAVAGLTGKDASNFAYPYGDVTLAAKKHLSAHLTSARSIVPGFNGPDVDLNLLRANRLYGGAENIGRAQRLIDENCKRRSWLIFYTHDVRPQPSEYGCEPTLLESAVKYAAQSGARIVTIHQVMQEIALRTASDRVRAAGEPVPATSPEPVLAKRVKVL